MAFLLTKNGDHQVGVKDLSSAGAHLIAPVPVNVGDAVLLKADDQSLPAEIAWILDPECGISFLEALPAGLLKRLNRRLIDEGL